MAPPPLTPSFLAVVLTLLAIGEMSVAQAKPVGHTIPVLAITSSIKMGQPIFGGTVGPFTTGQQLTLTCSSEAPGSASLSWWEGDTEQESSVQETEGIIISSFTIPTLRIEDNGRRFTCLEEETRVKESVEVHINAETLAIIKDDEPIEDGEVVKGIAGGELIINCVVQGYNPSAVSWWEEGAQLESVASMSPYATNSVLSLKALTIDDSGRSFTCRQLNGQLSKTVILDVEDLVTIFPEEYPYALALVIVVLILLVAARLVMAVLIRKTLNNKKGIKGGSDAVAKENEPICGVIVDDRLLKVFKESKYVKLVESGNGSISDNELRGL